MTPLHVASSQGSLSVAKCLINAEVNLRSLDEEQMTPLHFACMEGNLEVAKLLFETGMNLEASHQELCIRKLMLR